MGSVLKKTKTGKGNRVLISVIYSVNLPSFILYKVVGPAASQLEKLSITNSGYKNL
jgi:hypothetical protein